MDDKEFWELLDRCLEGAATPDEERLLIGAAESSPERRRQILDLAVFDAALRSLSARPEDLVHRVTGSIGHQGKTRAFARVLRTRLERERRGASGIPPIAWGLGMAAAALILVFFLSTPREVAKSLSRISPPEPSQPEAVSGPAPSGQDASRVPDPSGAPEPVRPVQVPKSVEAPSEPAFPPVPRGEPSVPRPATPPAAAPAELIKPTAVATLEGSGAGIVLVLSGNEEIPASPGTMLLPGQGLRTLEGAIRVMVRFADGTRLELGSHTELREIQGEESTPAGVRGKHLRLTSGVVRAVVARQPKGQPLIIETPNAFIKVIGTIFRIGADQDPRKGTLLEVEEGKVELKNSTGKTVEVPAGYAVWAAGGIDLGVKPIPAIRRIAAPCPVLDPSFANQTSPPGGALVGPWAGKGPAQIGVDNMNGRGGNKKCGYIFEGSGSGSRSEIVQTVSVNPNTTYLLSCFIQTNSTFPARGSMGVRNAAGGVVAQQPFGKMTDYAPLSVRFNSGTATSVVIFAGFTSSPGQSASWVHVDEWSMAP